MGSGTGSGDGYFGRGAGGGRGGGVGGAGGGGGGRLRGGGAGSGRGGGGGGGGAAARARPQGGHGVDGGGHRVGGVLVVGPPAYEVRPGLLGGALDREADLKQPVHRLGELLVGEGDLARRFGLAWHLDAHRRRDPVEALEPAAQAQPGRHGRRGLRGHREEQRGGVHHGEQRGHPGRQRPGRTEPDKGQVGGV